MTKKPASIGLAILSATVIALGYAGWRIYRDNPTEYCAQTRTVVLVNGEQTIFCCPACGLTLPGRAVQSVKFLELMDYETGKTLAPEKAFVVRGSEINPCITQHMLLEENNRVAPMDPGRCTPSVVAFARKEAAEHFLRVHGGSLLTFRQLVNSLDQ